MVSRALKQKANGTEMPVQFTIFLRFKLLVNDEEENFWSISNSTVSIYEKSKSLILDVLVL